MVSSVRMVSLFRMVSLVRMASLFRMLNGGQYEKSLLAILLGLSLYNNTVHIHFGGFLLNYYSFCKKRGKFPLLIAILLAPSLSTRCK